MHCTNRSVRVVEIRWQGRAEPEPPRTHFMRTASPHVSFEANVWSFG